MKFNNLNIYLATAIALSCGSCSSGDRELVIAPPTVEPPTATVYTDPQIIDMTQKEVTRYFWDYAEVNSKLARERYHTDNPGLDASVITTGGSGFV